MNNVWYYCTSIQIGYRLKMGETVTPGPILGSHERCKVQKRNIQSQTSSHDQSRLNTLNESMLSAKLAYRSSSYRLRRARKLVRSWMELYYIPRTAFLFTFGVRSPYVLRRFALFVHPLHVLTVHNSFVVFLSCVQNTNIIYKMFCVHIPCVQYSTLIVLTPFALRLRDIRTPMWKDLVKREIENKSACKRAKIKFIYIKRLICLINHLDYWPHEINLTCHHSRAWPQDKISVTFFDRYMYQGLCPVVSTLY